MHTHHTHHARHADLADRVRRLLTAAGFRTADGCPPIRTAPAGVVVCCAPSEDRAQREADHRGGLPARAALVGLLVEAGCTVALTPEDGGVLVLAAPRSPSASPSAGPPSPRTAPSLNPGLTR
ncbi:hypothetical protein [Streptomyces sp. KL2]|uniref:hypothetical protein n=1 Tax=Streptomyces sp. KL2 TaxID=3050126 RepID=UPI00397AA556